ncbi:MAG: hypothetical protein Q7K33_01800 [Candidatus Berkelbacteria bacterium]|nr:hypothetical protein [Candidatus Berkelbacteria bacterium]
MYTTLGIVIVSICVTLGAAVVAFLVTVSLASTIKKSATQVNATISWVVYIALMVLAVRQQIHYLVPWMIQDGIIGWYTVFSALVLLYGAFFGLVLQGIFSTEDPWYEILLWLPCVVAFGYVPLMYLWDHVVSQIRW